MRTVFESGAAIGPSAFEAELKAQAQAAAEAKKRAEAAQRAKAKAEREAKERANAAILALPPAALLALACVYRQGEGAGRSASWDDKKGDFREAMERLQFKVWLQKQVPG